MKNRVIELKDVDVEVVKIVGVIEFLEGEISFEEKQIASFREGVANCTERHQQAMANTYLNCIYLSNDKIRDLKGKIKIQKELLELYELEYKEGALYRYTNEDHEEWLMEQIDPNLNGGVL